MKQIALHLDINSVRFLLDSIELRDAEIKDSAVYWNVRRDLENKLAELQREGD